MYFKIKTIKGRKYRYAVKSIRILNGKVVSLEKIYKNETRKQLEDIFDAMEKNENLKYALKTFGTNYIMDKELIKKIEFIRLDYKKIIKKLTKTSLKDLFDRFTANFTYESNALEGNSLTLKDVVIVMFEKTAIKGKDLREIYETRNSREVVDLIIKNKFSISSRDIIKMHKMLVKDLDIQTGYKTVPNVIVGKDIKTTPPEMVDEKMNDLIRWYGKNEKKLHPLILASIFHAGFEQIHPFEDGNGRVGRFLINVILTNKKYPPLIIRKSQRLAYLKSLENFDFKHYDTIKRFMIKRFIETYRKFFGVYVKYV